MANDIWSDDMPETVAVFKATGKGPAALKDFVVGLEAAKLHEGIDADGAVCVSDPSGAWGGLTPIDDGEPAPKPPWRYPTGDEKPVIINAGGKQTVIPPKVKPAQPQTPAPTAAQAGALFDAIRPWTTEVYDSHVEVAAARRIFVAGCRANPDFYHKWRQRLTMQGAASGPTAESPTAPEDRSYRPRPRQRVVDT